MIKERIITDAEAKAILEKKKEPKYEQKNALEILKKFVKLDVKKTEKLVEELKKIGKLRERQIVAIANFLPNDREDLRAVLHKEYSSFSQDEIDLILEKVKNAI